MVVMSIFVFLGNAQVEIDTTHVDSLEVDIDRPICGNTTKGGFVWFPDEDAQFPGGLDSLMRFIAYNIEYPPLELYECEPEHKVYVSMIIQEDGIPCQFRIEKGSLEKYNTSALECIKTMPPWIPAKHKGENVRSKIMIPIVFML